MERGHPCPPERPARTWFEVGGLGLSVLRTLTDKTRSGPQPCLLFDQDVPNTF